MSLRMNFFLLATSIVCLKHSIASGVRQQYKNGSKSMQMAFTDNNAKQAISDRISSLTKCMY